MAVHIVQCLCPRRHCIMGLAWEPGAKIFGCADLLFNTSEDACHGLEELISFFVKDGQIDPWCGICKSVDFNYEDGVTRFATIEEALPHIREQQTAQLLTRAMIELERIGDHN